MKEWELSSAQINLVLSTLLVCTEEILRARKGVARPIPYQIGYFNQLRQMRGANIFNLFHETMKE